MFNRSTPETRHGVREIAVLLHAQSALKLFGLSPITVLAA
jgi:hypothetical protein